MNQEALDRLAVGECYLEALKVLVSAKAQSEQKFVLLDLPANMLAGFSLELLLKGYLLLKGKPSKATRSFGHQIDGLVTEARSLGLPTVSGLDDLIDTLGKGHADFTYRYIESGMATDVYRWDRVLPIFENLIEIIGNELRGQKPKS